MKLVVPLKVNFLSLSLLVIAGCTFTMEGNVPKAPGIERGQSTINASSYSGTEEIIAPCEDRDTQIARVRFHTNPGYLLASILSLGFYVPQHVEWWCGPLRGEEEDEEIWQPDDEDS